MASSIPLTEIREEGPSVTEAPTTEIAVVPRDHRTVNDPTESPRRCPIFPRPRATRRGSSRVDIDYFDPEGVNELSHTLSRMSTLSTLPLAREASRKSVEVPSDVASEDTLASADRPFDFEKGFRDYIKERDEAHIKSRELGVYFKNLRVVGLGASASIAPTLGSVFNPMNLLDAIRNSRHPHVRDILSGFEGVVRPGEMLLVLGSPGSGCSTLLKTLTNQRSEYHAVEGDVYYDSLSPDDVARHYRGDIQYCPEDDIHFPTLTVGQTVHFAATMRAPRPRVRDQTRKEYTNFVTRVFLTLFGLRHVTNTPVGDAAIRGVSGGEKKRVSISETMANRSLINAWDNSTRGLDASTALEFVRALRIATDIGRLSTIVSIYQAGESLYELFDKVCLIYEGKMVYYGSALDAKKYFFDMGYELANRQTTADFLLSVTDPIGRTPRPDVKSIPRTAAEFEEHYRHSSAYQANKADMESFYREFVGDPERVKAYKESALAEHAKNTREKSPYMISIPMQVRSVMARRVHIIKGNWTAQAISTATFVIQAIIIGTTFLDIPDNTANFFGRGGVLFFALFLPALFTSPEIPALFSQRPIILRHQKAAMYHPFVEALAMTLVDVPMTFITVVCYTVTLYFLVQLQQTAGQFFIFFLIIFIDALSMKAFFRMLAAGFRSEAPAQSVAGIFLLALALYTGFTIPNVSMIGALKWISYINPLRWAFEALISNEFHTINGPCSQLVPSGPGYESVTIANQVCTVVGSVPGQTNVDGNRFIELSFAYSFSHLWRNFGILIAFGVLFVCALLIFTEFNTGLAGQTSVVLYKRGSKAAQVTSTAGADEEKHSPIVIDGKIDGKADTVSESLSAGPLKMSNVFSWQHLKYVVTIDHHERRQLLDDVSGYVAPGVLTALMGESGAGKTTLLNVLAERAGTGVVSGDRLVSGQPLPKDFQAQTGYCQQTDTHVPTTTVLEALEFSAMMRQPQSVPTSEKKAYAQQCLKMCGLEEYRDAMVGSLDIEHRKRTTIGVELAAKPQLLLFLDEPTSGLDSQSAWAIMAFLRSLADGGQAILCTIHQPSAELFQVFDRLLLLRKGGQTVYFGDLGENSTTLINYFERSGARPCKPAENPAEYMLDVIGAGATATSEINWHDAWKDSPESRALQTDIEKILQDGRHSTPVTATLRSEFATSWVHQTKALTIRNFSSYWRSPTYLLSKLALNVIGGLFIGFTFFKSDDSIQGTQNKLFAVFMAIVLSAPLGGQVHVTFIDLRNIYEIREKPSRIYHWSALITSQIIVELPWNILGSTLFFICWYWTVGYPTSRGGYTYLAYGILFPVYWATFAHAVAAFAPTAEIAGILFSFFFSFVFTFAGILQPYSQLGWWRWMYHLSPYTYLIEGIFAQAVGGQKVNCATKELVTLEPPSGSTCTAYLQTFISRNGGYLVNPNATSGCSFCPVRTTDEWFGPTFNMSYAHHWRNLGIFAGYIVFNVAMVYILTYLLRVRSPASLLTSLYKRITARRRKTVSSEAKGTLVTVN